MFLSRIFHHNETIYQKLASPKRRTLRLETLEDRQLLAVMTGLDALPMPTGATTWEVNTLSDPSTWDTTDDVLSLREAISRSASDDTITFAPNLSGGTITLSGTELTIDKGISIDASALEDGIIIDGNKQSRVFYITGGTGHSPVSLSNLTITGGKSNGEGEYADGGGICNEYREKLTLTNCTITGNESIDDGGGIYSGSSSNLEVINCSITGNIAAVEGGGIHCGYGSKIKLTNSSISGNKASDDGGGVFFNSQTKIEMINCFITGNKATVDGGGIYNGYGCESELTNCSITGNEASDDGGGIFNEQGNIKILNCTIAGNSADVYGGGVYNEYGGQSTFENSIVALNTVVNPTNGNDIYGNSHSTAEGYNTLSSFSGWNVSVSTFLYDATKPLFLDAGSGNYTLAKYSQAINRGNNEYIAGYTTDLAGNTRIVSGTVDLGTYEFQGYIVNTLEDIVDATDEFLSLREAINDAVEGNTIIFEHHLSGGTISLSMGQLPTISEGIIIDASDLTDGIKIDGNKNNRIFYVTGGSVGNPVVMIDLTIQNGKITNGNGAGVYNSGVLALTNCQVIGNEATKAGGGVFNLGALTVSVADGGTSAFSGNTASGGGAIFNAGATCVLTNLTFSGNTSGSNGGGAIYNTHNSSVVSSVTITDCDFTENTTDGCGGAIDNWGKMTISGGAFTSNTATDNNGGAIHNGDKSKAKAQSNDISLSLTDVDFYSNSASYGGAVMSSGVLTITGCDFGAIDGETSLGNTATVAGGAISIGLNGTTTFNGTLNTFTANTATAGGAIIAAGTLSFGNGATLTFSGNTVSDSDKGANIVYNRENTYPDWETYITDADEREKVKPFTYVADSSSAFVPISVSKLFADQAIATEDAVLYLDVDGSGNFVEVGKTFSAAELGLTSGESAMNFRYETGNGSIGGTLKLNVGNATPEISSIASAGVNRHQIDWSAIDGAKGYELAFSTDQENWSSVMTSGTNFTVSGLAYGEKIYYKVRGTSGDLSSDWSATSSLLVCPMDVNGDGVIGSSDFTAFSMAMNSRGDDSHWDARCDVNGDGVVSVSDLTYISMNWLSRSTSAKLTFPTAAAEVADVTTLDLDLSFVDDADADEDSLFEAVF